MTRIRPDKQIMRGPGAGYILRTDAAGELQYALLSAIIGEPHGGSQTGVLSIDKLFMEGNTLVLLYTDATGTQQRKTVDLTPFAVDVKLTGAILQSATAGTYLLELTQSDGTKVTVNLSDLIPVVTLNSPDIEFSGNGTPANPLTAVLKPDLKTALAAKDTTDEFQHLTGGNTVTLSRTPVLAMPIRVYRNGLRICHSDEWFNGDNPRIITLTGVAAFGDNGLEAETVVVDYYYLPAVNADGVVLK